MLPIKIKLSGIVFLSFFILTINSCKEDCPPCQDETNPECENYNPCHDKHEVTADFVVYENHEGIRPDKGWEYYDTDTLLGQSALFKAIEVAEPNWSKVTYTWIIGSETIRGKKSISRTAFPTNEKIPVTLIVSKKPHLNCFPNDDGKDTVTRYIVFPHGKISVAKWQGEYIGHTTDEPDKELQLGLYIKDTAQGSKSTSQRLSGLPNKDCQWQQLDFATWGYRQFHILENSNDECYAIKGIFRVFANDSIVGKYTESKRPNVGSYYDRVDKVFIGKRIK